MSEIEENIGQNSIYHQLLLIFASLPKILWLCIFSALFTWIFGAICLFLQEPHQDAIISGYFGIFLTIILVLLIIFLYFVLPSDSKNYSTILGGLSGFSIWVIGTDLTLLSAYESKYLGFLFDSPSSFEAHSTDPVFYIKLIVAPFIILSGLIGDFIIGIITEKIVDENLEYR